MNDALPADPLALHRGLLTLDTHIDIPWPTGPDPFLDGPRRVDLPKMQRGGLAAGCFVAYVPQAARTAGSEAAAFERAIGMLHAIRGMGRSENGVVARVAVTAERSSRPSATACWRSSRRSRTASRWAPSCRGSRGSGRSARAT